MTITKFFLSEWVRFLPFDNNYGGNFFYTTISKPVKLFNEFIYLIIIKTFFNMYIYILRWLGGLYDVFLEVINPRYYKMCDKNK